MEPVLSAEQIYNQQTKQLGELNEAARNSTILVNEKSELYRENLISINDRIILISVGSASLFLTFIGVLFGANRNTTSLQYWYVVAAIIGFVLSASLLLVSRWLGSLFIYSTVHLFHLADLKSKHEFYLKILSSENVPMINSETFEQYAPGQLGKRIRFYKRQVAFINKQIKTGTKKKERHDKWSKLLMLSGYIILSLAYASSLVFFINVLTVMSS